MITFDLKSGYHHVDIHKDFWFYLGFSWYDFLGRRRSYVFPVLPFGLSTACYVFTKLLRPLVKHWMAKGIRAIDDGICAASSTQEAERYSVILQADLEGAGFVLNLKSRLSPHQVGDWLGFMVDLSLGYFIVPDDRITRLKKFNSLSSILQAYRVSVHAVASIVGQVMSMSLPLGPISRLRTRALYGDINTCVSWKAFLCLSEGARAELNFWQNIMLQF